MVSAPIETSPRDGSPGLSALQGCFDVFSFRGNSSGQGRCLLHDRRHEHSGARSVRRSDRKTDGSLGNKMSTCYSAKGLKVAWHDRCQAVDRPLRIFDCLIPERPVAQVVLSL
jgi:hypothetical protein